MGPSCAGLHPSPAGPGSHHATFTDQLFLLWITPLQQNICITFAASLWSMRKSPTSVVVLFPVFLLMEMNQTWEVPTVWLKRLTMSKMSNEWKPQIIFTYFIMQKFCNEERPGAILMEDVLMDFTCKWKVYGRMPCGQKLQLKIYLKSILKMEFNLI